MRTRRQPQAAAALVVPGAAARVVVATDHQGTAQLLVVRPGGAIVAASRPWREAWGAPRTLAGAGAAGAAIAAGSALVAWPLSGEVRGIQRALPGRAHYSPLVTAAGAGTVS